MVTDPDSGEAMASITTCVADDSPAFTRNREGHLALIGQFRALEARVRATSSRNHARFEKRGQLLPRERLALLLDRERRSSSCRRSAVIACTTMTARTIFRVAV